jgi:hypothetical protein
MGIPEQVEIRNSGTSSTDKVPYIGAISNVNLGTFGVTSSYSGFSTIPAPSAVSRLTWNDVDGTLDLGLKGGNVTLQIGQEQVLRVVNKSPVDLLASEYKCVFVSGAQGLRLSIDLSSSTSEFISNKTIGVVTEDISKNGEGFVTTSGMIRGVNTTGDLQGEDWTAGDILYLSSTVDGGLTNILPIEPNVVVLVGYVIVSNASNGSIFIKVFTVPSLDKLNDVKITSPLNDQALRYIDGLWINAKNKLSVNTLSITHSNTTTSLTSVSDINSTLETGVYNFKYMIRYNSELADTGIRLSVNYTGDTSFFVANVVWVDTSATDVTKNANQSNISGGVMGAFSTRSKSTTGWGTTLSVDVANSDMLITIEGTFESTTVGNIELWHGSEVASTSSVLPGTNLVITKTD